jgi:hypothetical protein
MGNIRYATYPPDCDAMAKANEKVRRRAVKDKNYDLVDPKTGKFKRQLSPDPRDPKDAEYRKLWMDSYLANIPEKKRESHYSLKKPKNVTPGRLKAYCEKGAGKGDLIVSLVDEETKPVEHATVTIDGPTYLTLPAEDGTVRVDGITSGTYRIRAVSKGYGDGQAIVVVLENQTNDAVIEMSTKPGTLIIQVEDVCNHALVPNSHAGISRVSGDSDFPVAEKTAAGGEAIFSGLSPGVYRAWMSRPWRYPLYTSLENEGPKFTVNQGETKRGSILLRPVSISIAIRPREGTSLAGFKARISGGQLPNITKNGVLETETGEDGKVLFAMLKPDEKYTIEVWKRYYFCYFEKNPNQRAKMEFTPNGCRKEELTVGWSQQPRSSLKVTVLDWDEKGIPSVEVTAVPYEGDPEKINRSSHTDSSGVALYAETDVADLSLPSMVKYGISANIHLDIPYYNSTVPTPDDGIPYPTEQIKVQLTNGFPKYTKGMTDEIVIRLLKFWKMEIWIESASWKTISVGPAFSMTISMTFGIRDTWARRTAYYKGDFTIGGGSISKGLLDLLKLKIPVGGAWTKGPGPAKNVTLPRFIGNKFVNELSFESETRLGFIKTKAGTISIVNLFNVKILDPSIEVQLEPGPTTFTEPKFEIKAAWSPISSILQREQK